MEPLKPRDEIFSPAMINRYRGNLDHSTGIISQMTLDSVYDEVETIDLNSSAPESVRTHFEIARNLLVYSWFVYAFNIVAIMQALASLEMAVRQKTGDDKTVFKNLLDKVFRDQKLVSPIGPPLGLSIAISKLRNDLAHGSPMLHGQGAKWVRICADLINELYS